MLWFDPYLTKAAAFVMSAPYICQFPLQSAYTVPIALLQKSYSPHLDFVIGSLQPNVPAHLT